MRRTRTALLLSPALVLLAATSATAAPTKVPQVKDAKGDAATTQAAHDIVSVLYTTGGTGTGKAYSPKKLVVTMTLAGPVAAEPLWTYEVEATTDQCGDVAFTLEQGSPYTQVTGLNGWADWGDCTVDGESAVELLTATVKGSTITWSFGIKASPLEVGAEFTDFRARVDPTNPAVPFPSSTTGTELGLVDAGSGDSTWVLE